MTLIARALILEAIIAIAAIGIAFPILVSGLNATSQSMPNLGLIAHARSYEYTIAGDVVYTGTENISPYRTTSGSDAAAVIGTVFGWMSSGQSVEFVGGFMIASSVSLGKSAYLDFSQATVTGTTAIPDGIMFNILSPAVVTFFGGNWTGALTNTKIRFQSSAGNSVVDGMEAINFKLELIATCGPNMTVKNCNFHDGTSVTYYIASNNPGNNTFKDCVFAHTATMVGGIYCAEWCSGNLIEGCTFDDIGYHSIYLSSYDTVGVSIGNHIIHNNTFENFKNYNMAGVHVKCRENKIYNNVFKNFASGFGPCAISLYSDFAYSNANDNEIYNNSFSNMWDAIRIGNALANQPEYRNKIFNNSFTNISSMTGCISLNYAAVPVTNALSDTWIYYNKFINCPTPFPFYTVGGSTMVKNTVIAYNEFDTAVPSSEVTALQSYVNTLIYGNGAELADYPVPLPSNLPIPPPEV